ncbi:MerR family transcriptional regulator [Marixanthomonas ophiurae]|uniref:MerR family transcriptional regulator n=1 Tax=Marixanthomonas ophiurae TaxID=387659 RepID=A0A3E1QDH4_9FLAO|nr:MerR family transcriptional regulator [Marixanthomonas ophiurae]RFN60211.1 MerR family transcriptional regulator [Marixanthomonas ophiurae]
MSVETKFSIKDLENLSGIKAHTIRIWEKRYNLLEPERTNTNIREYSVSNLKKLLNIAFLYNTGFKISKIAALTESEIINEIESSIPKNREEHAITILKTAMFEFNHPLFSNTLFKLEKTKDFRALFFDVFIPLLNELGTLWHTGTIDPAHEHFISELIKQKIIINIEALQKKEASRELPTFCLYLPYNEIHEIGLLFAHYEILKAGFNTIYLGTNIPLQNLEHVLKHHKKIIFLSYFTVKPEKRTIQEYINEYNKAISYHKNQKLWLMGRRIQKTDTHTLPSNISTIKDHQSLIKQLKTLKKL